MPRTRRAPISGSPAATDAGSSLLAEARHGEVGDRVDRGAPIGIVGRDLDLGASGEPERHDAEQALRVGAVHRDLLREPAGEFHELGCRAGVRWSVDRRGGRVRGLRRGHAARAGGRPRAWGSGGRGGGRAGAGGGGGGREGGKTGGGGGAGGQGREKEKNRNSKLHDEK